MKKIILGAILLLSSVIFAKSDMKMGILNIQRIKQESSKAASIQTETVEKLKVIINRLTKKREEHGKYLESIQKKIGSPEALKDMSEEEKNSIQEEYAENMRELSLLEKKTNEKKDSLIMESTENLNDIIDSKVREFAKENNYSIIIPINSPGSYAEKEYDVTTKIIKLIDKDFAEEEQV